MIVTPSVPMGWEAHDVRGGQGEARKRSSSGSSLDGLLDELDSGHLDILLNMESQLNSPLREHWEASGAASCYPTDSDDTGEMPQDLTAYYEHPLISNDPQTAILHEYQNLHVIDNSDIKIGEKYGHGPHFDIFMSEPQRRERGDERPSEGKESPTVSPGEGRSEANKTVATHRSYDGMLLCKTPSDMGFLDRCEHPSDAPDEDLHSDLMEELSNSSAHAIDAHSSNALLHGDSHPDILQQAIQSEGVELHPNSPISLSKVMKNVSYDNDQDLLPKDIVPDPSLLTLDMNQKSKAIQPSNKSAQKRKSRRKATKVSRRLPVPQSMGALITTTATNATLPPYDPAEHDLSSFVLATSETKTLPNITETFGRDSPSVLSNPSSSPAIPNDSYSKHSDILRQTMPTNIARVDPAQYATPIPSTEIQPNGAISKPLQVKPNGHDVKNEIHHQMRALSGPRPMLAVGQPAAQTTAKDTAVPPSPVLPPHPSTSTPVLPIPAPHPPHPYVLLRPGQKLPEGYVQCAPPVNFTPPVAYPFPESATSPGLASPGPLPSHASPRKPTNPTPTRAIPPQGVVFPAPNGATHSKAASKDQSRAPVSHSWHQAEGSPVVSHPTYAVPHPSSGDPRMVMVPPHGLYPYHPHGYGPFYQLPNGQVMQHPGLIMPIAQHSPQAYTESKTDGMMPQRNSSPSKDITHAVSQCTGPNKLKVSEACSESVQSPPSSMTSSLLSECHSGRSSPSSAPCTPKVLSTPGTPISIMPGSAAATTQPPTFPPVASVSPLVCQDSNQSKPLVSPVVTYAKPADSSFQYSTSGHHVVSQVPNAHQTQTVNIAQISPQNYTPYTHGSSVSSAALVQHYAVPQHAVSPHHKKGVKTSDIPTKYPTLPHVTPPSHSMASHPQPSSKTIDPNLASSDAISVTVGHVVPSAAYRSAQFSAMSTCDLQSPDSGYADSLTSPADQRLLTTALTSEPATDEAATLGKRRRSSTSTKQSATISIPSANAKATNVIIPKLDPDLSGYRNYLETNISTTQRINEDRITYLNKGQFYGLVLEFNPTHRLPPCGTVKSVIMVVFREEKPGQDDAKAWDFWYSRQHSIKMRILDYDTKNSEGVVAQYIEETAHNAVAIRWNPMEKPAKINIAINCLSTDFSNQKGVKGLPLHLQIDTFEDTACPTPIHRSYCQVKVFCDKGAERKTRDEEKRRDKTKPEAGRNRVDDVFHPPTEISEFYGMAELTKPPLLFTPRADPGELTSRTSPLNTPMYDVTPSTTIHEEPPINPPPAAKRMRSTSLGASVSSDERVLLYVREDHEKVFTALHLHQPTVQGLSDAIKEKYNIVASNIYKRSKKGILVKMDEDILKHYSNESTFVISMQKMDPAGNTMSAYEITLSEI